MTKSAEKDGYEWRKSDHDVIDECPRVQKKVP